MNAKVIEILIAEKAKAKLFSINEAELVASKGIVGDRYYKSVGIFSKKDEEAEISEVTLIESEEIESFNSYANRSFANKEFRRNIVTKGIKLNNLVGKEFYIDSVKLRGTELCEPCGYLANLLVPEVMKKMAEGAGIRAKIISGGNIVVGSEISVGSM